MMASVRCRDTLLAKVGCGSNRCHGLSLHIIGDEIVEFKNWREAFYPYVTSVAEEGHKKCSDRLKPSPMRARQDLAAVMPTGVLL
jgi:hypothetical protein